MKWLKDKLGRAFWWVVLILAAIAAFVVAFFIRRTPTWFGKMLDKEVDKQDRRRTVKNAREGLEELEKNREKRIKKNADRADARVDDFKSRMRKRREEANANKPD